MAAFQNWSSLQRIDTMVPHDNDISLYNGDQLVLTVGRGVTFGFLKLLYNAELSHNCGTLLGVKLRGAPSQKMISSDDAFLDKDEYELVIEDYIPSVPKAGSTESVMPTLSTRHIQNIQQFFNQFQFNATPNQRFLPQLPLSLYSLPSLSSYNELVVSTIQQSLLAPSTVTTSATAHVPFVTELPQVNSMHTEAYTLPETEPNLQDAEKAEGAQRGENESISQMSVDEQAEVGQEKYPSIRDRSKDTNKEYSKEINYTVDTGELPYQCEVCHIPFKSKTKLDYHKRRHTDDNPHMCTYCGEAFKFYHDLSKHRDEQHLCNKTFKCDQCTKSFSSRKELERHMWRHTGKKTHKCELCGKEYTSATNLSLHRHKHTGVKPLKCSLCPKTFRHKTALENHIRMSHTGERPFVCMHCKKAFPTRSQLSSHEKRHSDSKPYKCTECGKAFRQGHILKRHSLVHTNERPYKCHVCPKSFRELSNLQYHKRTHFDKSDRSVVCPLCGKNIITGRGVKRHLKLYHNKICKNENEARSFLRSIQVAEKPSEETSSKPFKPSVNGKASSNRIEPVAVTPVPPKEGTSNGEVPPTRLFDVSQNRDFSTTEGVALNCKSLRSETAPDSKRIIKATKKNINMEKTCSIRKNGSNDAKFRCSICSRTFRGPKTLTNHMKITHGDCRVLVLNGLPRSNRLKCKCCNLLFANESLLLLHTDKVHSCSGKGTRDVAQESRIESSAIKQKESKRIPIEESVGQIESQRVETEVGVEREEFVKGQNSEKDRLEAGVVRGNIETKTLVDISFLDKEGTRPRSGQEGESLIPRIDSTQIAARQTTETQGDTAKQNASCFGLAQADDLQSDLLESSGSDTTITQFSHVDHSRPDLMPSKMMQKCENKEPCRCRASERSLINADGTLSQTDNHSEVSTDCEAHRISSRPGCSNESSFQVIYSCVSKQPDEVCILRNENEEKIYPTSVLKKTFKPTLGDTAENNTSKGRNSNVVEQLTTSKFDGNIFHVLENESDRQLTEIEECRYKGRRLPVIGHDVLENEPPPGYSFGFLPILVANGYFGETK